MYPTTDDTNTNTPIVSSIVSITVAKEFIMSLLSYTI